MRIVKYTGRFRRDYKREKAGQHNRYLDAELLKTLNMLVKDERLDVISITRSAASGAIIATATSGPT